MAATTSFHPWLCETTPEYDWTPPHLVLVQEHLDAVTRTDLHKLMILMPPRHGKSEQTTVRYPPYRLERDPRTRIIIAGYNTFLSETFSRKARAIAERRGVPLAMDRRSAWRWETVYGGGVLAAGIGSGVTGTGAQLLIVDDPVKSRKEAESVAFRETCWNWYKDDLYSRREPGCAIIVQMTHWHFDDLAGRILNSEDAKEWTVLKLAAEAMPDDPIGRAEGEALWPRRFPKEELQAIHKVLGDYAYSALYQQHPVPRSGNMFPREKITLIPALPAGVLARQRAWDMASKRHAGDYTVGLRMSQDAEGYVYIEDIRRGQWEAHDRDVLVQSTAKLDDTLTPTTWIAGEQEPGSSGKDAAGALVRLLAGHKVKVEPSTGDKVTRADPFAAQWQAGNVRVLVADWTEAYLQEMESAPMGIHDDQMDASALAYSSLQKRLVRGAVAVVSPLTVDRRSPFMV